MIFLGGLIMGLAASLHCSAMCGPLVLAIHYKRPSLIKNITYHTGRLIAYLGIGLVFGLIGQTVMLAIGQGFISIVMGILMLIAFFVSARIHTKVFNKPYQWLKSGLVNISENKSLLLQFNLGFLNGLLPCGMVYMAAAAAVATGNMQEGMVLMLGFGLATWPLLFIIVFTGKSIAKKISFNRLLPLGYFALSIILIIRGLWLGVPYLSPALNNIYKDVITVCGG